jgi:predicted regulator of Ras-like GTPase activity (Roadblock/LC7/MglB family)
VEDPGGAIVRRGDRNDMIPLPAEVPDSSFKHDGVLAVLTIRDGTVQGVAGSPGIDPGMIAATLTLLMKESEKFAGKLGSAPASTLFLEFRDRLLLVQSQGNGRFTVVIAHAGVSLGRLSYQLGKVQVKEGLGA